METLQIILIYLTINSAGGISMNRLDQAFTSYEACHRYEETVVGSRHRESYRQDMFRDGGIIRISSDNNVRVYSSCIESVHLDLDPLLDDRYTKEPRVCCMALIPSCMACAEGIPEDEWRARECAAESEIPGLLKQQWGDDTDGFTREEMCHE